MEKCQQKVLTNNKIARINTELQNKRKLKRETVFFTFNDRNI